MDTKRSSKKRALIATSKKRAVNSKRKLFKKKNTYKMSTHTSKENNVTHYKDFFKYLLSGCVVAELNNES